MIAIAVDDEMLMLGALVSAVKASPDISEVVQFSGCDDALAFVKENSSCDHDEISSINQFFHILDSVAQTQGCVRLKDGLEKTVYSSCCNADTGVYYYKTYDNSQITAVSLHNIRTKENSLDIYPLRWNCSVQYENVAVPPN